MNASSAHNSRREGRRAEAPDMQGTEMLQMVQRSASRDEHGTAEESGALGGTSTGWELPDIDTSPLNRHARMSIDLPELSLPDPALAVPPTAHVSTTRDTAAGPLRPMQALSTPLRLRSSVDRSGSAQRTRFDLAASPSLTPRSPNALGVPLRPILNPSSTQGSSWRSPAKEQDIADSLHSPLQRRPSSTDAPSSPEPVFAPRDDDEPHPEHFDDPLGTYEPPPRDGRMPHPLYTPVQSRRRRRRRRSKSNASSGGHSGRSGKSARRKVKNAWRSVKRKGRKVRGGGRSHGSRSSKSSSSSSSSSSSRTTTTTSGSSRSSTQGSSSRSSSTWAGWRFWRNSSSGSSTSSGSSDSDSEWEPPTPHFTLLTPCLSGAQAYPDHLFAGGGARGGFSLPATPGPVTPMLLNHGPLTPGMTPNRPVFDLLNTATLHPALERLQQFWLERRQEDNVGGDLGTSAMTAGTPTDDISGRVAAATPDEDAAATGYFPPIDVALERVKASRATRDGKPATTPPPTARTPPPTATSTHAANNAARKLKGEERAARAEEKRFGKGKSGMEEGPAWWLDIMCPTVADMKELRKLLPLHPLTIEDILHQETREKIESFPALGYYFIIFRALDESYFRYTSPDIPASTSSVERQREDDDNWDRASRATAQPVPGMSSGKRGRVDIVEGVGGKEGVEGVSVGAVNMYLVVFGDGILSFHFEDISKHAERVQGKLQTIGLSRAMSSHWIAYCLMDSIVDAFFPLIGFIESESNEVDTFLADPLNAAQNSPVDPTAKATQQNTGGVTHRRVYDDDVVGIGVEDAGDSEKTKYSSDASAPKSSADSLKKTTIRRHATTAVFRLLPSVPLPSFVLRVLPQRWIGQRTKVFDTTTTVDGEGYELHALSTVVPIEVVDSVPMRSGGSSVFIGDTKFDRSIMLKRIADMRMLVTGLSRLLAPKLDVVRALRKRAKEESVPPILHRELRQDINIYLGDLYDHLLSMQQSLNFYEAILAHDHPAYIGVLRLALQSAKAGTDLGIVKLTIVTVTFLALNIYTSLFGINAQVPHNGDREFHRRADGSQAPFIVFPIVVSGVVIVMSAVWLLIWLIYRSSASRFKRARQLRAY